ncbi:MAG: hypothetical protein PHQ95_00090 [Candidatus Gracilibacteria bacterium]|nr:hypothetical protein [Candidatus Gracilibacteria bacterium]
MQIVIVGSAPLRTDLFNRTSEVLTELGLSDIVKIRELDDEAYKMELGITENPALCIEEETIEFRDVIFQGIIPEKTEIKSLLISIVGGEEVSGGSCGTGGCGSCSTAGGCH